MVGHSGGKGLGNTILKYKAVCASTLFAGPIFSVFVLFSKQPIFRVGGVTIDRCILLNLDSIFESRSGRGFPTILSAVFRLG